MICIKERDIVMVLSKLADYLGGNFSEDFLSGTLKVNNNKASGVITAYELFPGLAALIFDLRFNQRLIIEFDESYMNSLNFVFCLKGNVGHKFKGEKEFKIINFQQNVILATSNGKNSIFSFEEGESVEASFLYLLRNSNGGLESKADYIRNGLDNLMSSVGSIDNYKFFGQIRPKTAKYIDRIIHHDKKGVVGRLLVEGSILSILALQIKYHDDEANKSLTNAPLNKDELIRILKICDEISESLDQNWTIEKLTKLSGLNSKKLQAGFRYLFNMSVNGYIKNMRLETALELLQTTDLSISEVVYKIGISSRSYFSRIFKIRYGYMPSEYKSKIKSMHLELLQ